MSSKSSIEINDAVRPPPGIKLKKRSIPKKFVDGDILSLLSDEQLNKLEHDALKKAKNKEDIEKKRVYEIGLLQLAGMVPAPSHYYTIICNIITLYTQV